MKALKLGGMFAWPFKPLYLHVRWPYTHTTPSFVLIYKS